MPRSGDVRAQFGRRLLEGVLDAGDDVVQRVGQGFQDLVAADREGARHAFAEVAALDFHLAHFAAGEGRADLLLDAFGSGLADQHAVVAADVVDDRFVKLVAANAHAALVDHAAEADDAHLGRAAADVDDHRTRGLGHRQASANRRGHRLFDQVDLAGAGAERRFADRAALDLGRAAGHADDDPRARAQHRARMDHLDELLEHLLGDGEIGDHAVLHRSDGFDVARHLAEHGLGLGTDGLDGLLAVGAAFVADGDHRGLIEHDPFAAHVDQRVGGAEVDGEVGGKVASQGGEHEWAGCVRCAETRPTGGY